LVRIAAGARRRPDLAADCTPQGVGERDGGTGKNNERWR
jgi:hypothetical protein